MAQHVEAMKMTVNDATDLPIIVIGNGPVGLRVAEELQKSQSDTPLLIFGEEPHEPYSRLRLSSWLAGDTDWFGLMRPMSALEPEGVQQRIGYRVVSLTPAEKTVTDDSGATWGYRKLVLATGSSAHVPRIPGVQLPGVYRFHGLDDAMALLARRAGSHHSIIVGAGLLGLEAARGMQRLGTRVTVIDHADRLLPMQLDERGSAYLEYELGQLGIALLLGCGVVQVLGAERVQGVRLRDGTEIPCDTVIMATGIRPNIDLAKKAGLSCRRGIRVDDGMRTSDPEIYAVGDCAEHREQMYGLLEPGLEQAAVAAAGISGSGGTYDGSIASSQLKVMGTSVFSVGPMGISARRHYGRSYRYSDSQHGIYRKILVHRHRLVGAIGIGKWTETDRLRTHIENHGWVMPWQVPRFLPCGHLWRKEN